MTRIDVKAEYERIGGERAVAGRLFDRERRNFMILTLVYCWMWSLAGIALIGQSAHIHAQIGWIELPRQMALAKTYFWGGVLVGGGGSFFTLVYRWRKAMDRGMFD